jgi:phenylacetate-coenzyme A ligase PaaK-like adenylate-forming protein
MREGLDYFMGISVVLARMGEQFEQQSSGSKPSKELLHLPTLWRLLRAVVISKIKNRNILPKDIWHLKGIMSGGTDTEIYKDKIEHYWGKKPLEGFACTEAGNMAMQAWNFKGMVFFPDNAFLEFIPMQEYQKNKDDPSHKPETLLYDELAPGVYELVISNFNGGVLVRYRIGDLFEVISDGDAEIGSELPQVRFYSRADDIIDLGSFLRLTEREIWKTIEASGLAYRDWVACKQINASYPSLRLYIELADPKSLPQKEIQEKVRQAFSKRYSDYNDMKEILGIEPVEVGLIPVGAFAAYMKSKMEAGADLAHLKPPHMKPSDEVLKNLLKAPGG